VGLSRTCFDLIGQNA